MKNKFIAYIFIPLFLLGIWFAMSFSYVFHSDYSFSVLSHNHSVDELNLSSSENRNKISGEFIADKNYLGAILLPFDKKKTTYAKHVLFKIKEKDAASWLHESKQSTTDFYHLAYFPLGFPVVEQSQGKTYTFELEITNPTKNSSLGLVENDIAMLSKYQFPKAALVKSIPMLIYFLQSKVLYLVQNSYYAVFSAMYLLPFVLYIAFLFVQDKFKVLKAIKYDHLAEKYSHPVLIASVISIFLDIVANPNRVELVIFPLIILYLFALKLCKLSSSISFIFILMLLFMTLLAFVTNLYVVAEKTAMWIFILLIISAFHTTIEIYYTNRSQKIN